ncbi:hypothetical protein QYF61_025179 [Mycteria americana]|uniref:Uncharacterized protein n=1 Tax=Mycteria americana TaxID=33587 RepID=A0AAN7NSE3_MYCAM|nr:hypothetical protein QYF61_025179 [Mycteria americana]
MILKVTSVFSDVAEAECITTDAREIHLYSLEVPKHTELESVAADTLRSKMTTEDKTSALDPSPASLPFSGHTPAPPCLSCSGGPKTEHRIRGSFNWRSWEEHEERSSKPRRWFWFQPPRLLLTQGTNRKPCCTSAQEARAVDYCNSGDDRASYLGVATHILDTDRSTQARPFPPTVLKHASNKGGSALFQERPQSFIISGHLVAPKFIWTATSSTRESVPDRDKAHNLHWTANTWEHKNSPDCLLDLAKPGCYCRPVSNEDDTSTNLYHHQFTGKTFSQPTKHKGPQQDSPTEIYTDLNFNSRTVGEVVIKQEQPMVSESSPLNFNLTFYFSYTNRNELIPDSPCRFVSSCVEENAKYTQKKLKRTESLDQQINTPTLPPYAVPGVRINFRTTASHHASGCLTERASRHQV